MHTVVMNGRAGAKQAILSKTLLAAVSLMQPKMVITCFTRLAAWQLTRYCFTCRSAGISSRSCCNS